MTDSIQDTPDSEPEIRVIHDASEHRYEVHVGATRAGFVTYEARPGRIVLVHTEIDPRFEGQGLGGRLIAAALDDIRRQGLAVIPRCPFVKTYIERHPEYADLVRGSAH